MADLIQLLPDSVANQIAAGEVIQRPASALKELVENAVDAGASQITVNLRDAGKALLQVIDNGRGMSETDARMAFERHATSKISQADDLFRLRTLGFRGEALASVAAVAQVSLQTRTAEQELGTLVEINGSTLVRQEAVACPVGSNFQVKNLFFNVPARRKFLKANHVELRYLIDEFVRVALTQCQVGFTLLHNDVQIHHLPPSGLRERVANLFGRKINAQLLAVELDSSIVRVQGFVGRPEAAKRKAGEQFFFVNNRYMRSSYFQGAVVEAYQGLLPPGSTPSFFLYLEVDPGTIDVNIHPTKTHINFENAGAIHQILLACVKEALGKFNVVPSLDFEMDASFEFPNFAPGTPVSAPRASDNPGYNPFEQEGRRFEAGRDHRGAANLRDWQKLYEGFEKLPPEPEEAELPRTLSFASQMDQPQQARPAAGRLFLQARGRYIVSTVKSGLMLIDQRRAHLRVLHDEFLDSLRRQSGVAQQLLYPATIELDAAAATLYEQIEPLARQMGFDLERLNANTLAINGIPATVADHEPSQLLEQLLESYRMTANEPRLDALERMAYALARVGAIGHGRGLEQAEMAQLVDQLFACPVPNYDPTGKKIIHMLDLPELEAFFKA